MATSEVLHPNDEGCHGNVQETLVKLEKALHLLQEEDFTNEDDIQFLKSFFSNPEFATLCKINDKVAYSQSFDQPEGSATEAIHDLRAHAPCNDKIESELMDLLQKPFLESILSVHDQVRKRAYEAQLPSFDPHFHPQTNVSRSTRKGNGADVRTVGLHKSSNEPLGVTLKLLNNKLVIARILHGGLIHRQGLLQVGDRIVEVNGEMVDSMSPADLQLMLKNSSGSIVIRVEPGFKETAGLTDIFMKAHFDYNPKEDRLIPSQDAGLVFKKGDILRVLNQDDSFWWQAIKYGDNQIAGLIPSRMLEERRKAFNSADGRLTVGCVGKKKPKRKVMYSSHHCGEFECYDMILYEPVMMVEDFMYKVVVLIGAPNIGRRSLKTRLLAEYPDKYSDVIAHTTREVQNDEDQSNFFFVSENDMRQDIMLHKFIEFGKYKDHLYGLKAESIQRVIDNGKVCVLDVHPQALKHLRTSQFCPLVVFIKASSPDSVRRLHRSARVDKQGGFSGLDEKDFEMCYTESCRIENLYSHYFDASIVNENIDVAYEELLALLRLFSYGKRWVPSNWIM